MNIAPNAFSMMTRNLNNLGKLFQKSVGDALLTDRSNQRSTLSHHRPNVGKVIRPDQPAGRGILPAIVFFA
ncbi:MAG: hypothetical protein ACI8Z1_001473 [Candidatus Azotimanducaceae bacterium]|jgi:hypothetical protein